MEIEKNTDIKTEESSSFTQASPQFDLKRVLKLISNPLESMKLTEKDFLYGIIGIVSSYAGFLIWSLFVTKRINAFFNPFYELASFFDGGSSQGSAFFAMYSKLLFTGLWSTLSILGVVWLVIWWLSGSKPEYKLFLTRIGGVHYIGCVGYLLACILSSSFTFSLLIIVITLLTLLILTLYAGAQLYEVSSDKLSRYFILAIAGYVLLFSFIPQFLF